MIVHALFQSRFLGRKSVTQPAELTSDTSLLILHGGEDISPIIYGEESVYAHAGDKASPRDLREIELALQAKKMNIPILGICRGAQLLCALGGGSLWQHVDGHEYGRHGLNYRGEVTWTNTCHHQMMRPTSEMEVLATSPNLSPVKCTESGKVEELEEEPEIVYIPEFRAVCVQGHPEWLYDHDPLVKITKELLKEKCNVVPTWL